MTRFRTIVSRFRTKDEIEDAMDTLSRTRSAGVPWVVVSSTPMLDGSGYPTLITILSLDEVEP
jgi:hypothetical protein